MGSLAMSSCRCERSGVEQGISELSDVHSHAAFRRPAADRMITFGSVEATLPAFRTGR